MPGGACKGTVTMKSSLEGPFALTVDTLRAVVPGKGCGVFAVGEVDERGVFRVQRVGRADNDLQSRLSDLVGAGTTFKYRLTANARDAFERECELFHAFRPPGNIMHPDRPRGSDWRCPQCFQFHF